MAGVGFELQRLIRKGTLVSTVQAFLYGTVLAAGPIVLTVLTVGIIGWLSYGLLQKGVLYLFSVTVVYTFAFSLILVGPFQLLFTRYVADKHFTKDFDHIFPGFVTSATLVMVLAASLAIPFYTLLEITVPVGNLILYKVFGVLTFLAVCFIWQLLGFISTTKEYQKVFWVYVAGTITSIVLAYLLIPSITVAGGVAGFGTGQWLIALLLLRILIKDLKKKEWWRAEFFHYFRCYPLVALSGLFYNLGIWVDKFIFWGHFKEQHGASFFYTYNYYDVPNFLAFLTIVPALAYFLILTETNFYKDYSGFIRDVLHEPLLLIEQKKMSMITTLKEGLRGMMRLQTVVTLLLIVFAQPILVLFSYKGVSLQLFRILVLGVYFHVLALNINTLLLYYEQRRRAFFVTLVFAISNAVLTYITLLLGPAYFGLGFLGSTLITAAVAWPLLMRSAKQIDFYVFASQPIDAVVKSPRKGLWARIRGSLRRMRIRLTNGNAIYPEYYS
jgi:uncharacterized membrane protein